MTPFLNSLVKNSFSSKASNKNRSDKRKPSSSRRKRSNSNRLSFQKLEDRKLLAGVTFNANLGLVGITGTAGNDAIALFDNSGGQSFTVTINNDPSLARTFNYADVNNVNISAGAGDDVINSARVRIGATIFGQNGDDTIYGGSGDDVIYGGNGEDTILGNDGDDTITGQNDDDFIVGGAGDDTLSGGYGDDDLRGTGGNDLLLGQFGDDIIYGQDGDDTIRGWDGNDTIYGGNGADIVGGDDGDDSIFGGNGDDTISGNDGDDIITGQNDDDFITGGDGEDTLRGGYGDDDLRGNNGNDLLLGQFGDDTIYGQDGDDTIRGWDGIDTIYGGNGADIIGGDDGDDNIFGGDGNDTINGNDGNDIITGQNDNDLITGGNGDDTLRGGYGDDDLRGNAGNDLLLGQFGDDTIQGQDGDDTIRGWDGNDTLNGGNGVDIIGGDDGADTIFGGNGDDTINGGNGNDIITGQNDNDTIIGAAGDDTLSGGLGNDFINGNDGNDRVLGQGGVDNLHGAAGDDYLHGGSDSDADRLTGGSGLDEFIVIGGVDVVADRAGFETYAGFSESLTSPLVEVIGDQLFVHGTADDDRIHINRDGSDKFTLWLEHDNVGTYSVAAFSELVINGNAGDDDLDNDTVIPTRINGGTGDDDIDGGRGNDNLFGGAGNDNIDGHDGDDFIRGDNGDDDIEGNNGNDTLSGSDGNDDIDGGDGNDTIHGGAGNDDLEGNSGDDWIGGNEGNDRLRGQSGDDTLHGHAGRDELFGGSHDDILSGGTDDFDDHLEGDGGTDTFYAVRGDDIHDQHSSETSEDPVAGQTQLTQDLAGTELNNTQFDSFIENLPAGTAVETATDFTIVNTGAVKLAFLNDGSNRQIGSFPTGFSTADIANIGQQIITLENNNNVQALGDPSFSVVPVAALEGTVSVDPASEFALVAAGTGGVAVVGEVESSISNFGVRTESIIPFSSFQTTNSANVVANIAGLALGRGIAEAAGSATLNVLAGLQGGTSGIGLAGQVLEAATRFATFTTISSALQQPTVTGTIVQGGVTNRPTFNGAVPVGGFGVQVAGQGQGANIFFNVPAGPGIDEVGFVQLARSQRTGSRLNPTIPLGDRRTDRADANGWFLDRDLTQINPFYGRNAQGGTGIDLLDGRGAGVNLYPGNTTQHAIMFDAPTDNGLLWQFETYAVVTAGDRAGEVLAGLSYTIDQQTRGANGLPRVFSNGFISDFSNLQAAQSRWNAQPDEVLQISIDNQPNQAVPVSNIQLNLDYRNSVPAVTNNNIPFVPGVIVTGN